MTVYILLYISITVIFILQKSNLKMFKDNKKNVILMFFLILLVVGLRNTSMGNDLPGYIYSFQLSKEVSLGELILLRSETYEIGFIVFIKILSLFLTSDVQFLFTCVLVSLAPIVYVLYKCNVDSYYSTITYIAIPSFLMLYSGLRQNIAFGLCFLALYFLREEKIFKYILSICVAMLFHSSAFVFFLTYPAYNIYVSKKNRIYTLIALGIVFLLREPLFLLLSPIIGEKYSFIVVSDSYGILIFLLLNYILAILFANEKDKEVNGYINILYIGMICQVFASVNHMVMRISEYFILVLVMLVPKVVFRMRKSEFNRMVLASGYVVMLVFMGLLFIYQGGSDWAKSYPYYWFWEDYLG